MVRAKGVRPVSDSPEKRSGMLPRRRRDAASPEERHTDPSNAMTSQMRRRWEVPDDEAVTTRFVSPRSAATPTTIMPAVSSPSTPSRPEPGFVEDEPEDGIPTPRPRMAMTAVAERVVSDRELVALPLDHRAGFVLSHIDGTTDLRTLIDLCGMSHEELVAVVDRLLALRAIRLV